MSNRNLTVTESAVVAEVVKRFDEGKVADPGHLGQLASLPSRSRNRVVRALRHRTPGEEFGILSCVRQGEVAARTAVAASWQAVDTLLSAARPAVRRQLKHQWVAAAHAAVAGLADGGVAVRFVCPDGRMAGTQVGPDQVIAVSVRRVDGGVVAGLHRLCGVTGGITLAKGLRVGVLGQPAGLAAMMADDPLADVAMDAIGDIEANGPTGDPLWPVLLAELPAEDAEARMAAPTAEGEQLALEAITEWLAAGQPAGWPHSPDLPATVEGLGLRPGVTLAGAVHAAGDRWPGVVRRLVMAWLSPPTSSSVVAVPLALLSDATVPASAVAIDLTNHRDGVVTMSTSAAAGVDHGWAWDLR
jgi:alkylated DNA nucleotide flippase Atl1